MLLPGHDTAMMICLIPPLRRRASGDGKVSRKNVSDVAKAPLRCSPGDGAKSHLSSWWTSHTYPLTDRVKPEERRRRGAPIDLDVSSQKREVFVPLANHSLDCKRLGGCVNSMVDWGRAHVWSVERPPLVPKGEKELEARLRCGDIGFRKAGSELCPRALPNDNYIIWCLVYPQFII